MRVWTLSASSTVRRIAKDPVGSIFFQLVRLDFRGCDDNWSSDILLYFKLSTLLATEILSEVSRFVGFNRAVFPNVCCSISKPLSGKSTMEQKMRKKGQFIY
ncbi:hypothetical protein F2Q70_00027816 [Brassica cretica]|uniref:Uncharacterized protein n=1 Tax=Brassica cretica TaxID=69181 RepID=A0A8S9LHT4_BRACR|nr:hypothetical protein F2Q70_00027816 [Brassica cretica]